MTMSLVGPYLTTTNYKKRKAKKITDKMLHPILKEIHESSGKIDMAQFEQSKQDYFKQMQRIGPSADHVVDDSIQTDQLGDPEH